MISHEEHCVACGHPRLSYYLTTKNICVWCDFFIPDHIPSEQAKKYLKAIILKQHNRTLVYEKKTLGFIGKTKSIFGLERIAYSQLSSEDVTFLDKISGVSQNMTSTYASSWQTSSQQYSASMTCTVTNTVNYSPSSTI